MTVEQAILNMETIAMLKSLESSPESTEFLDDLIQTYLRDAPDSIRQLSEAIEKGDLASIKHYAHKLKGASRNLGVVQVGELAGQMEARAIAGTKATKEEFGQITDAYKSAITSLQGLIGRITL